MKAAAELAAVEANAQAWRRDIITTVDDEARRTGKPEALIASEHLARLQAHGAELFVVLIWADFVAWKTGQLPRAAARRWERAR